MLHIANPDQDPAFNLALEEYFLKHATLADDLVILWRNKPTVVIGRNQNFAAEVNQSFIRDNGIQTVRRLSGGGAVYHDLGNLNFTFITALSSVGHNNFAYFTRSVIAALSSFGVTAEFSGRNDLTIDGQKFSGNAQYIHHDRLLHHGTLLFDTDLAALAQALAGIDAKHPKPAVASVRSRVTTLRQHLPVEISLEVFAAALLHTIFAEVKQPYQRYELTPVDRESIDHIASRRYRDKLWTYGKHTPFNRSVKQTFPGGTVQALLLIEDGIIRQAAVCGDFFATGDMDELAGSLIGIVYQRDAVAKLVNPWLAAHPLREITAENLLACLLPDD